MLNLNKTKTPTLGCGGQIGGCPVGWGGMKQKMRGGDQKLQTSNYKISHGDVTYSMVTVVNNTFSKNWSIIDS